MRRSIKILIWALFVAACGAFTAFEFRAQQAADHTPPEIRMDAAQIEASVSGGDASLLSGVSARDARDGDVSASLLVESVSAIRADHTATVTYAAFDRAGNVAKAQREVQYTDYQRPVFSLTAPLLYPANRSFNVYAAVHADDAADGSLDDHIKATLVEGDSTLSEPGLHQVEFRVRNSFGDTVTLPLPVEVYTAQYNATLRLKSYLIYVPQGETFRPQRYLDSFETDTETIDLGRSTQVVVKTDNPVDTAEPGVYAVTYTAEMGDYQAISRLIVVVEEEHAE